MLNPLSIGSGIAGSYGSNNFLDFWEFSTLVFCVVSPVCNPTNSQWGLPYPHIFSGLVVYCFVDLSHSNWDKIFNIIFLIFFENFVRAYSAFLLTLPSQPQFLPDLPQPFPALCFLFLNSPCPICAADVFLGEGSSTGALSVTRIHTLKENDSLP